jgi:hypothetical protein
MWLLDNAGYVNLYCALAVLLGGGVIYWFLKPKLFEEHPFCQAAFGFWLLQWFMLIVTWAIYSSARSPSREVLAAIDLYGVANLGFFLAYAEAEAFQWSRLNSLAGVYGVLLLWNLLIGTEVLNRSLAIQWHWLWILPSETFSALSLLLVAWVFLRRYGPPVIPLAFFVIPAYIFLQRPTYFAMFIGPNSSAWTLALGFGKLCYGLFFYTVFFLPARNYQPLQYFHSGAGTAWFSKVRQWSLRAAGALAASVLATVLSEFLASRLKLK